MGNVLIALGYDVKLSEVHGMSQRGGVLLTNTQKTWPMPVITDATAYPEGIEETVPPRFLELNKRAFELGRGAYYLEVSRGRFS